MTLQSPLTSHAGTSATLWLPNNQTVPGQVAGRGPQGGLAKGHQSQSSVSMKSHPLTVSSENVAAIAFLLP